MAKTYKRLGATTVIVNTDTALYTVPTGKMAIVSELTVCNKGTSQHTFRIAHVDGAISSVANEDYKYYDTPIDGNQGITFNIGLAMSAGDTILVRADSTDVVFSASGVEID